MKHETMIYVDFRNDDDDSSGSLHHLDDNRRPTRPRNFITSIPEDYAEVRIHGIKSFAASRHHHHNNDHLGTLMDCKTLTNMFQQQSFNNKKKKKLSKAFLNFDDDDDEISSLSSSSSPPDDYLTLLITIFSHVEDTIHLRGIHGDAAYSCLTSSLMKNNNAGPRRLRFECPGNASLHQANMFLEGISLSNSLKRLEICRGNGYDVLVMIDAVGNAAFSDAMRRKSGLKRLLHSGRPIKLKVDVEYLTIDDNDNIPFEIIAQALCQQEECSLKNLYLLRAAFGTRHVPSFGTVGLFRSRL